MMLHPHTSIDLASGEMLEIHSFCSDHRVIAEFAGVTNRGCYGQAGQ